MDDRLYWYKAELIKIVDGDTLSLKISLGLNIYKEEQIRLFGINTPETFGVKKGSEEYNKGMQAKAFVENFVTGKQVYINTIMDKTEKYGRLLANVYVDGVCLNDELIKNGLAERYK
jgi:micrococcal nuclease